MSRIGIIGGSGFYKIEGISGVREQAVETPFGEPSDVFITGELSGREVVFLPRHGRGHRIPPGRINYRANIFAMKKLGVSHVISVTACGSLKEELKPLDFVAVDQFVDRTNRGRTMTFFDQGIVAHIMFAQPVCPVLNGLLYKAGTDLGLRVHKGGTYLNMEGPAFSTLAESRLYRSWGMDVIGMTNIAESRLAREAEMCYATLACVTDYDCWHPEHDSVTVEMVIANLQKNVENAKRIAAQVIASLDTDTACGCRDTLRYAIITDRSMIPEKVKHDLEPIIGKYMDR